MPKHEGVSLSVIKRLPRYYRFLGDLLSRDVTRISSRELASLMQLTASQIRQDLNCFGGFGQQGYGYNVAALHKEIGNIMGLNKHTPMVLIGAGNLGRALLSYGGFSDYGLEIVAAFDRSESVVGSAAGGKIVLPLSDLGRVCEHKRVQLGILTVPASEAQKAADQLVGHGIKAIWNFAPTVLKVPFGVLVENENLASSLAVLSKHLSE